MKKHKTPIILIAVGALVAVIVGAVCGTGHCSSGDTPEPNKCPACTEDVATEAQPWYTEGDSYLLTGDCDRTLSATVKDQGNGKVLELQSGPKDTTTVGQPLENLDVLLSGDEDGVDSIYVDLAETKQTEESWTVVFKVAGSEYMGLGGFDGSVYKTRPEDSETYNLLVTPDTPYYFPFFISKNPGVSLIYLHTDNKTPARVTVHKTSIKWEIFKTGSTIIPKFYTIVSADLDAALSDLRTWEPVGAPTPLSWDTNKVFTGPLTSQQIQDASSDNMATDYILDASESALVKSPPSIASLPSKNVLISLKPEVTVPENSGFENDGLIDVSGVNKYVLDYGNTEIKTYFEEYAQNSDNDYTGLFFMGTPSLYESMQPDDCPAAEYKCALKISDISEECLSSKFGDQTVFRVQNNYQALQSAPEGLNPIGSVAYLESGHVYRNFEFTMAGAEACYNNMVALDILGVSLSCNMCSGVHTTSSSSPEDRKVCLRYAQIALLFPTPIMMVSATSAGFIESTGDDDTEIRAALNIRAQQFTSTKQEAIASDASNPIKVYNLGANRMMFLSFYPTSGTENLVIEIPYGKWMSLPNSENKVRYYKSGENVDEAPSAALAWLTSGSDLDDMIFYKLGSVHTVINGNALTVRVFSKKDATTDFTQTIDIYEDDEKKGQVTVSYKYKDSSLFNLEFAPVLPSFSTAVQIAAVEVYMFDDNFNGEEITVDNTNEKVYKITEFEGFAAFPASEAKTLANKSGT